MLGAIIIRFAEKQIRFGANIIRFDSKAITLGSNDIRCGAVIGTFAENNVTFGKVWFGAMFSFGRDITFGVEESEKEKFFRKRV